MTRILTVATHASDDPTKCTMAVVTTVGALAAGKEVSIALLGEAAYVAERGRGECDPWSRLPTPSRTDRQNRRQ